MRTEEFKKAQELLEMVKTNAEELKFWQAEIEHCKDLYMAAVADEVEEGSPRTELYMKRRYEMLKTARYGESVTKTLLKSHTTSLGQVLKG